MPVVGAEYVFGDEYVVGEECVTGFPAKSLSCVPSTDDPMAEWPNEPVVCEVVVGLLELQLLYVPKPRGALDDHMPKSMSSAASEMGKARMEKETVHEGHLSQQGGDCIVSPALHIIDDRVVFNTNAIANSTGAAASSASRAPNSPPTTSTRTRNAPLST